MTGALALATSLGARDVVAEVELPHGRTAHAHGRVEGPDGAPLAVVLGGVSAHRYAADGDDVAGWWRDQAGPGRALDTQSRRVLSIDFLGEDVAPFPTTEDQARAVLALADALGAKRFDLAGASYGGMVALALAALAPDRARAVFVTGASARAAPTAQAWRSTQRAIVAFAQASGDPQAGVALARRIAMTTYRTPEELDARFGPEAEGRDAEGVEAYLAARGRAYAAATPAARFLALSRSLDAHDVDVCAIRCPVVYVAVTSDRLVSLGEMGEAARATPRGTLKTLASRYGHDAFLKEPAAYAALLREFLEEADRHD